MRLLLLIILAAALGMPIGAAAIDIDPGGSSFRDWVTDFRREAREKGISPALLDRAFAGLEPLPRVVELDRSQPEFQLTFQEYLSRIVPPQRVAEGRAVLADKRELLDAIEARFGVPPEILVALWGIESGFGRNAGSFPVIGALATLAFEGRRADFFRGELLSALLILEQGHIPLGQMTGSWAGAMGQVQFMPSTFLWNAVDFDGDGRKDIWNSEPDAIASAANYLAQGGWRKGEGWGEQVSLPEDFPRALAGREKERSVRQWIAFGVEGVDMDPGKKAALVLPAGETAEAFLVTGNYRVLLRWNRSTSFALAVGLFADRLEAADE